MSSETVSYILDQTCIIQQIPAPTFSEERRAEYLADQFGSLGLEVKRDSAGNVLARIPGGLERPLVITAHMDTVHPVDCDLTLRRSDDRIAGPGIGDNSVSLGALLGIARQIKDSGSILPGDLWLVGTTAEEGLGNLAGMKAVVQQFGKKPLAYIVLEGMGLGLVYHRALGVNRYRIAVDTAGGHSWGDYGMPSAIHELSHLVYRITRISLPKRPRTTLNVGVFHGGISINTIANLAWMEVDLRSEDHRMLKKLVGRVQERVKACDRPGVVFSMKEIGNRPAGEIPQDHPLVQSAQLCLQAQDVQPILEIGSTDASVPLSYGYPAICIGLTRGSNAHTSEEFILTAHLPKGINQVLCLIERTWAIKQQMVTWQAGREIQF